MTKELVFSYFDQPLHLFLTQISLFTRQARVMLASLETPPKLTLRGASVSGSSPDTARVASMMRK